MAEKKGKIGRDLTSGNVFTQMLAFALPLLLTSIIQQSYNSIDTMVIGHFVGSTGTVGVSVGGDMATLFTFFGSSMGSAAQIYIAQLVGAKRQDKIERAVGTLFVLSFALSMFFTIISMVFCNQFLALLNTPEEAFAQARSYMMIVSLGLPFVFLYSAVGGVMRGMGESKRPLLFVSISAVANLIMDLLFVVVIPLESAGTAIATVAAQFASFFASVIFVYKKKELFNFDFKANSFKLHKEECLIIVKLGIPLAIKSCLTHGSQMVCSAQINTYGLVASATNSIGHKINKFVNIFTNSIDAGAATMIGQCLGAEKTDRAKKAVHVALGFAFSFAAVASVLALVIPRELFALYTSDAAVIEMGVTYMRIAIIGFVLAAIQGPCQSMITGSGFTTLGAISGIVDSVVLRIGISFLLAYGMDMGVVGFFYGNALARLGPAVIGSIYFLSGKWKTRKLLSKK